MNESKRGGRGGLPTVAHQGLGFSKVEGVGGVHSDVP